MDFEKRYTVEIQQLGKRLKEIRVASGLTQVDLEVKTGINNGDISRIEQGKLNIEFFTMVKFAEALGVTLDSLFTLQKKPWQPNKRKQPPKKKVIKKR